MTQDPWNRHPEKQQWWREFGDSDNPFFRCPAVITRTQLETRALYGGQLVVYNWQIQPPLGSNRATVKGKAHTLRQAKEEARQEAKALLVLQSK